jgi:hypothetical protein
VSIRERRNRKDRRAKTPEQLRRDQPRHEATYGEATARLCEADFPLNAGGYLRAVRLGTWMPVCGPLPGADPSGFKQA